MPFPIAEGISLTNALTESSSHDPARREIRAGVGGEGRGAGEKEINVGEEGRGIEEIRRGWSGYMMRRHYEGLES